MAILKVFKTLTSLPGTLVADAIYFVKTGAGFDTYVTSTTAVAVPLNTTAGSFSRSVNTISVNTTAGTTVNTEYVYLVSGTTTLTLPTAVGNSNQYAIKNTGSAVVTVATTSSQTIDGSTIATMPVANSALTFVSDGANWFIV